ncbi:MAG: phage minor head protein [Alphaproteobacteria bacterium]
MTGEHYIWRTVKDSDVRPAHAAREGKIFSWTNPPEGGHPGEDYNCRCWAETVKRNCDKEKARVTELEKQVKDLTERFNDLLLRLQELIDEGNALIASAQKSLGARIVTFILTLPFDRLGFLGELLQRYFENIISSELIEGAENFMRDYWAVKQKAQYII